MKLEMKHSENDQATLKPKTPQSFNWDYTVCDRVV